MTEPIKANEPIRMRKFRITCPGHPMLSKVVDVETGAIIPVAAIDIHIGVHPSECTATITLVEPELDITPEEVTFILPERGVSSRVEV